MVGIRSLSQQLFGESNTKAVFVYALLYNPCHRLTKEMIDAMGGPAHLNYQRFCKYCCQAFNVLRRSTNVVLSLIMLMRDAGVEALRGSREQTDTTVAKVCVLNVF